MLILFIVNIFIILVVLKINYIIFKEKMYYPFRLAELFTYIFINIILFFLLLLFFNFNLILVFLIINSLIFYILYHLINMIQTSPRTKILMDLHKFTSIHIDDYKKIYNEKIILEKRIKRFFTSNQIKIENNKIYYINNNKKFLFLLHYIFQFIKKI